LRLTLRVVKDRYEVVGVELWSTAPPDFAAWKAESRRRFEAAFTEPVPIRATTIRLPLERLAKDVVSHLRRYAPIIRSGRTPTLTTSSGKRSGGRPFSAAARRAAEFIEHPGKSTRGRQPFYDEDHFVEVARIYSEALLAGRPPTLAVAKTHNVSKSTAAHWISRARDKGYLPPTSQGAPAGSPISPSTKSKRKESRR